MSEERQTTIVGLFTLGGLVVLCLLVFLFGGGRTLFASTYPISVHFPQGLIGVQSGQGVTLYGKRIGETKAVNFWNDQRMEEGVKVVVAVEKQFRLPAACEMVVATSIMSIGRPTVQIVIVDPRDSRKLPTDGTGLISGRMVHPLDQVVPPHMQTALEQATKDIGGLAQALTPVAENLNRLLQTRDLKEVDLQHAAANVDTVVQRFDAVLKNLNAVLGDEQNQGNLREALANARKMSESGVVVMQNLTEMSEDGKIAVKDADALMRNLASTADDFSCVLRTMDQTLALLNDRQGSMGLFLNDNRLYEEMVLSARRLTKALDDMREVLDLAKQGKLRIKAF
jgi:phospholipid/cholesterol/gamma-HCH transport system substrate-binding protein